MALGYAMRIGLVFIHLALLTVCAVLFIVRLCALHWVPVEYLNLD